MSDPFGTARQLQRSLRRERPWTIVVGVLLAVYLLVPMLIVIPASFTSGQFLQVPPDGLSFRWYAAVLQDPMWLQVFVTSLQVSGTAAVAATVVGTLAALGLARIGRGARWFRSAFFLPMVLPYVVFALGLRQTGLALGALDSLWPLTLGQAVLALPIAFLSVTSALAKVDPALSRAASSMGASWWYTVWRVELPLIRGSLLVALVLAFAFAFDEVVLALFLAPPGQSTLPAQLYTEATQNVSPLLASVAGFVILLTVVLGVIVLAGVRIARRRTLARLATQGTAS